MKSPIVGLRFASAFFAVGCLAHVIRLVLQFDVIVAGYLIPLWMSGAFAIVAAALALWMWRLSRRVSVSRSSYPSTV